MRCSSSWTACRQPTDMSQKRSASDLAGAHRCEMPARKRPGCRCRRHRVQIVQLRGPFSFFSASCARVSQASAISSKACRSFPLIWLAMRMQSAAYFLNFSDSRNLASSVPAKATPIFGTLFFNNFVMRNCGEPLDPDATFTSARRGGFVAVFFRRRLPAICRGMCEVGATGRRPRRQGTAPGHGRNVSRTRRQKRCQALGPARRLTGHLPLRRAILSPARNRRRRSGLVS